MEKPFLSEVGGALLNRVSSACLASPSFRVSCGGEIL